MNLRRLCWTAAASMAAMAAHAAPLDTFLDFDDNAVPAGWSIFPGPLNHNSNYGVGHGVFYAQEVDSSAYLSLPYAPSAGVTGLDVAWDGSVFQTYWGNNQGVDLANAGGTQFLARAESNAYLYGDGMLLYVGDASTPVQQLPLTPGTYQFHAHFADHAIRFSASLNGTQVFDRTEASDSFLLRDMRSIELAVYETIGPESWLDNVRIQEQVSAVPELPSGLALAAGLAFMLVSLGRKGRGAAHPRLPAGGSH